MMLDYNEILSKARERDRLLLSSIKTESAPIKKEALSSQLALQKKGAKEVVPRKMGITRQPSYNNSKFKQKQQVSGPVKAAAKAIANPIGTPAGSSGRPIGRTAETSVRVGAGGKSLGTKQTALARQIPQNVYAQERARREADKKILQESRAGNPYAKNAETSVRVGTEQKSLNNRQKERTKNAVTEGYKINLEGNRGTRAYVGAAEKFLPGNQGKELNQRFGTDLMNRVRDTTSYKAGEMLGIMAQYASVYGIGAGAGFGKVVSQLPQVQKLSPLGQAVARNTAYDAVFGTPLNYLYAKDMGLEGKDLAKNMALNAGLDFAIGGAIEAVPFTIKGIKGATGEMTQKMAQRQPVLQPNGQVKYKAVAPSVEQPTLYRPGQKGNASVLERAAAKGSSYIKPESVSAEMIPVYDEYIKSVDAGTRLFAEKAREGRLSKKAYKDLSTVSLAERNQLKELTGVDTLGYKHRLKANTITEHIDVRHGVNGKANQSMADVNDLSRVDYVLRNYDNVELVKNSDGSVEMSNEFRNSDNSLSPEVKFSKRINGHYYVVTAVPDNSNRRLNIVTAYIEKANGNTAIKKADQLADALTPSSHAQDAVGMAPNGATASNSMLHQTNKNVNPAGGSIDNHFGNDYIEVNGGVRHGEENTGRGIPTLDESNSDVAIRGQNGSRNIGTDRRVRLKNEKTRKTLDGKGVSDLKLNDVSNNSASFISALDNAKVKNKYGFAVSSQTPENMAGAKIFLSEDGFCGAAVKPDGDIVGVFKNPGSHHKGASIDLVINAIDKGGNKLDCYGAELVNRYGMLGFEPVARVRFNQEFAPPDWNYRLMGEPDVFVMKHNGDTVEKVAQNLGNYKTWTKEELNQVPLYENYEEALAYRDGLLAKAAPRGKEAMEQEYKAMQRKIQGVNIEYSNRLRDAEKIEEEAFNRAKKVNKEGVEKDANYLKAKMEPEKIVREWDEKVKALQQQENALKYIEQERRAIRRRIQDVNVEYTNRIRDAEGIRGEPERVLKEWNQTVADLQAQERAIKDIGQDRDSIWQEIENVSVEYSNRLKDARKAEEVAYKRAVEANTRINETDPTYLQAKEESERILKEWTDQVKELNQQGRKAQTATEIANSKRGKDGAITDPAPDYKEFMDDQTYGEAVGGTGVNEFASSLSGRGVVRSKDIQRNLDAATRGNQEARKWFRDNFETPFYQSKGKYAKDTQKQLNTLYEKVVREKGIRKGSKESAAVQWIGEGQRIGRLNQNGNPTLVPYTLEDLKADFSYKMPNGKPAWENIVESEKIIRKMYDDYVPKLNQTLREIYPNVEKRVADIKRKAYKEKLVEGMEVRGPRGNKGTVQRIRQDGTYTVLFKNRETGNQALVDFDRGELISVKKAQEMEDAVVGKRLQPRKDYFRHFKELQGNFFKDLSDIRNSATNIDPRLIGVSEFTEPKSRYTQWLQRRKNGLDYTEDAVGGMLEYIPQAEYKATIEPNIPKLRNIVKDLQESTVQTRNANSLIQQFIELANDLAGKTNPIDRAILHLGTDEKGRTFMRTMSKISRRARANAVVGNVNTMLSQFYNMPNVVGYAKNPADVLRGMTTASRAAAGDVESKAILDKSMFLRERYLDRSMRRFDKGVLSDVNKFLSWCMELGDKAVADTAFSTYYGRAIKDGLSEADAILKADELTRKAVAGRGIGEMPLTQKAELTKLLFPFQVEVRNAVNVLKDLASAKDIGRITGVFVTTFLMNQLRESVATGSIGFDPIDVGVEAIKDVRSGEKTVGEGARDAAFGMTGELLSNYPGGSYVALGAQDAFGLDQYTVQKMFGENDPTRFGTGNMAVNTAGKLFGEVLTGRDIDLLAPAMAFGPAYGGKQIERGIRGLQDMAVLPREKINLTEGASFEKQDFPASYSKAGGIRFAPEKTMENYIKAPVFGSFATTQGKEYLNEGFKSLGDKKTQAVKEIYQYGGNPQNVIRAYNEMREQEITKKEDIVGYLKEHGFGLNQINTILEQRNMKKITIFQYRNAY